jgi:hypothetical protein
MKTIESEGQNAAAFFLHSKIASPFSLKRNLTKKPKNTFR